MSTDSSQPDFTLRIAQHRTMSNTYRTRAQATRDDLLRRVYSDLAATYENMAGVIERTTLRVESIQLTIAQAREKIAVAEPDREDDPSAAAELSQREDRDVTQGLARPRFDFHIRAPGSFSPD